jgi:hypothetical protein
VVERLAALAALAVMCAACGGGNANGIEIAGPDVDVSAAPGSQAEVDVAVDPRDDRILVAASNSDDPVLDRVYTSTDGGKSWSSKQGPPLPAGLRGACEFGDPAVDVDLRGRQYVAGLVGPCTARKGEGEFGRTGVFVAFRRGPSGAWTAPAEPVARRLPGEDDDKDALTVDTSRRSPRAGRVYVAWTRHGLGRFLLLMSWSGDGGSTWSRPVSVSTLPVAGPAYGTLATGPDGTLYAAWNDIATGEIRIARAPNGARFERDLRVTAEHESITPSCGRVATSIPAQPYRCLTLNPKLAVDASSGDFDGRVYLVYEDGTSAGVQDVYLAAYTPELRPLFTRRRVNPPDGRAPSDQFLPTAGVDQSDGSLWVCYYDTAGDPSRRRARFTCTPSGDGGRTFAPPVAAASVASDEVSPPASPFEYGEYAGLAVAHGLAHPLWTDSRHMRRREEEIFATTLRG